MYEFLYFFLKKLGALDKSQGKVGETFLRAAKFRNCIKVSLDLKNFRFQEDRYYRKSERMLMESQGKLEKS